MLRVTEPKIIINLMRRISIQMYDSFLVLSTYECMYVCIYVRQLSKTLDYANVCSNNLWVLSLLWANTLLITRNIICVNNDIIRTIDNFCLLRKMLLHVLPDTPLICSWCNCRPLVACSIWKAPVRCGARVCRGWAVRRTRSSARSPYCWWARTSRIRRTPSQHPRRSSSATHRTPHTWTRTSPPAADSSRWTTLCPCNWSCTILY